MYTLMMSDRYGTATFVVSHCFVVSVLIRASSHADEPITSGLLYYLATATTQAVLPTFHELRALLQRRNDLAAYLVRPTFAGILPPVLSLSEQRTCARCFQNVTCAIYHKVACDPLRSTFPRWSDDTFCVARVQAVEGGSAATSPLGGPMFETITSHLTQQECDYLARWHALLHLEQQDTAGGVHRGQLWTVPPFQREQQGRYFLLASRGSRTAADLARPTHL